MDKCNSTKLSKFVTSILKLVVKYETKIMSLCVID